VRTFAPGDELVELRVPLTARRRDPTLPMTYLARAIRYHRRGFRPQVLLSSLLDPVRWPARELVALYHERWELELGLDELKTDQMARAETLRSQTPWAVRQEIWGLMVGYNLVRRRALATAQRRGVAAIRVSFVVMQSLGFTLATKQPSMTAATLAGAMGEARGARDYVALSEHIARTARSQLAAVKKTVKMAQPGRIERLGRRDEHEHDSALDH
jgi:hypothetical protein